MARIRFTPAVTLLALAGCAGGSHLALPNPSSVAAASRAATHETILHFFSGRDGAWPNTGRLVADRAGNLYGATIMGGSGAADFAVRREAAASSSSWFARRVGRGANACCRVSRISPTVSCRAAPSRSLQMEKFTVSRSRVEIPAALRGFGISADVERYSS